MGWWSTCILGGDAPLDLLHVLCSEIGVAYNSEEGDAWSEYGFAYTRRDIDKNLPAVLKRIEKMRWDRGIAYQVLGHMILSTGAKLPAKLRDKIVAAAESDEWAQEDEERAAEMAKLIKALHAHTPGKIKKLPQKGLLQLIEEKGL